MSISPIFQRGGSFFHRRLTKLYSDAKQTYETATVTSRTESNPDVASLQREYRIQKDRLLAWGLDWSDSDAAEFPDVQIDASVDQAGFGDVVAHIMSTIQDLLVESEKLQTSFKSSGPESTDHGPPGSFPTEEDHIQRAPSQPESASQLRKSRNLLMELTACIDYLFKLSQVRRANRKSSKDASLSKESFIRDLEQLRRGPSSEFEGSERTLVNDEPLVENISPTPPQNHPSSALLTSTIPGTPPASSSSPRGSATIDELCARTLNVTPEAIIVLASSADDGSKPPTYDAAVGVGINRVLAEVNCSRLSSAQRERLKLPADGLVQILIETTPMRNWSKSTPTEQRLAELESLQNIHEPSGHMQLHSVPRLMGYFLVHDHELHVSVYQISEILLPAEAQQHGLPPPVDTLNSLFPNGSESTDSHMPSLEDRFRLAFSLVVGVLQFQTSNTYHGSVNSSNIVLSSARQRNPSKFRTPLLLSHLDFRSLGQDRDTEEPFSAKIYRHPWEATLMMENKHWACDSYSLGLVLLEIGLWVPLRRFWKQKYDNETFKSRIRNVYTPKLASRCGSAYMKAVQACIDAADTQVGGNGSQTHLDYMVKVLEILSRCCAIDLDGPPTAPLVSKFCTIAAEQQRIVAQGVNAASCLLPSFSEGSQIKATEVSMPRTSIPKQQIYLKKWDKLDVPQADLDLWNSILMPRLSKLLQNILGNSSESCSASLMMIGSTADTARTTICIQCSSVDLVRKMLKKHFRCKSGWGLVVLKGDVQRCGRRKKNTDTGHMQAASAVQEQATAQVDSCYQQVPRGGASIGAHRDYEHLPPVSFGGAIVVGGELYGMTVHHMLERPVEEDTEEAIRRSAAIPQNELEDLSHMGSRSIPTEGYDLLEISDEDLLDFNETDSAQDDFWFSDVASLTEDDTDLSEEDYDDTSTIGDAPGVDPTDVGEDFIVTQPAIDDVEDDFFPNPEDRDDDHLASHTLGYVHASSGIRRVTRQGVKHEVDWALVKINTDRLPTHNVIASPSNPHEITTINKIAPESSLPNTQVLCHGRTSGLQSGRISPALALLKMPGRQSFSNSYCVDGSFGVPGDSGAWVVDPAEKSLCGHVLAWGRRSRVAFIAPMEVMVEDMVRSLGAGVILPDEIENGSGHRIAVRTQPATSKGKIKSTVESNLTMSTNSGSSSNSSSASVSDSGHEQRNLLSTSQTQRTIPKTRGLPKLERPRSMALMMH